MARIFVYDDRKFPDSYPDKSPEEVKTIMTDFFPELASAEVREQTKDDDTYIEFVRKTGTKG